jgi:hypothetical protein
VYDYYQPVPELACLWCGGRIVMWQGKGGSERPLRLEARGPSRSDTG